VQARTRGEVPPLPQRIARPGAGQRRSGDAQDLADPVEHPKVLLLCVSATACGGLQVFVWMPLVYHCRARLSPALAYLLRFLRGGRSLWRPVPCPRLATADAAGGVSPFRL